MNNEKLEQAAQYFMEEVEGFTVEARLKAEQEFREYLLGKMDRVQQFRYSIATPLFWLADAIAAIAEWVEGDLPKIEIQEKIAPTNGDDSEETFILK